jgi:Rieske Fe-S protein
MKIFTRRDFLKTMTNTLLATSGLLGLGGILRFFNYAGEGEAPQVYDLGPAENYPPGTRTLVAEDQLVLVHGAAGFYTLSTTCTHLGCRLNPTPEGFECPCHASRFDLDGAVLKGPAVDALVSQPVEPNEDGHLVVSIP